MKFKELYEAMMLEATFSPKKKSALKDAEKLSTNNTNFQWYAEPEKASTAGYGIYIKANGKFYKATWMQAKDIDEVLIKVNEWMASKGDEFFDLIVRYLNKNYKLDL